MRLADYVIEFLIKNGIDKTFLVTGRGILFLTDAVAKNNNIKSISLHHEQSCSFAAYSDAIINDRPSCCIVSTGCGATNTITGVLNAWQDKIPIIFISGNNPLNETTYYNDIGIRTYGSQEANIVSIVKSITKYSTMITEANDIAVELEKAVYYATEGDKGPVWIDIPIDIQNSQIDEISLNHFEIPKCERILFDKQKADKVLNEISNSKRPIFIIGSGIKNSNSIDLFKEVTIKYNIPFVYTPSAVDCLDGDMTQNIGCVSSLGGSREGNFAVQNSDLIIILGSRMQSIITGGEYDKFAYYAKKIIVDYNENEINKKNIKYDLFFKSDLKVFLEYLISNLSYSIDNSWTKKCIHWKKILPVNKNLNSKIDLYNLSHILSNYVVGNTCIITDAGFEDLILPSNLKVKNGAKIIHPVSQGSMGFALPASIGVALNDKYNTICIVGDGSIMMNLQELQSIKTLNLCIKIIVINNGSYAVIRKRQKDIFRTRTIGTDNTNGVETPNWGKVAKAFGFKYITITDYSNLNEGINDVVNLNSACICEVICDDEQVYLHSSILKTASNKFVRRPMEDQSPFLDRDFIKEELLIPYKE